MSLLGSLLCSEATTYAVEEAGEGNERVWLREKEWDGGMGKEAEVFQGLANEINLEMHDGMQTC